MRVLHYKGLMAQIDYNKENCYFSGRLIKINDDISFSACSKTGLRKAIKKAVNDYINSCRNIERSQPPDW